MTEKVKVERIVSWQCSAELVRRSAVGSVDIFYGIEGPREGCCYVEEASAGVKRDVVAVARRGDPSVAEIAVDLDIAPESVRPLGAPS